MTNIRRVRIAGLAVLAALGSFAIYIVLRPERPAPIVGVVRTTEVPIAPEIGGHLAAIKVRKGDHVHAGDVLAELSAPELTAAVAQARAARAVTIAARDNVYAGVRDEEIAVLAAEIRKAQSRVDLCGSAARALSRPRAATICGPAVARPGQCRHGDRTRRCR